MSSLLFVECCRCQKRPPNRNRSDSNHLQNVTPPPARCHYLPTSETNHNTCESRRPRKEDQRMKKYKLVHVANLKGQEEEHPPQRSPKKFKETSPCCTKKTSARTRTPQLTGPRTFYHSKQRRTNLRQKTHVGLPPLLLLLLQFQPTLRRHPRLPPLLSFMV
jgi:hypothetical protein